MNPVQPINPSNQEPMPDYQRKEDLTLTELRSLPRFSGYSDEQLQALMATLRSLARILCRLLVTPDQEAAASGLPKSQSIPLSHSPIQNKAA